MSVASRRARTCGACGETGHDVRTCRARAAASASGGRVLLNGTVAWSDDELRTLRLLTEPKQSRRRGFDWHALRKALPGRTDRAIQDRATHLSQELKRGGRRWASEEDVILRREWGVLQQRALRQKLVGRSWVSIQWRASVLGLPLSSQGWETLPTAEARAGYDQATLRRIVEWANDCARWIHALSLAANEIRLSHDLGGSFDPALADFGYVRTRIYDTPKSDRRGVKRRRLLVIPDEIDAAVARYCRMETVNAAARRLRVNSLTLKRYMVVAGWLVQGARVHARLPPEVYDAVLAAQTHGRTIADHAERTGVRRETLAKILRRAGAISTRSGHAYRVETEAVDRALATVRTKSPAARAFMEQARAAA